MIWGCYKGGICQIANGKKQITGVMLAPDAVGINGKLKMKKLSRSGTNKIRSV